MRATINLLFGADRESKAAAKFVDPI